MLKTSVGLLMDVPLTHHKIQDHGMYMVPIPSIKDNLDEALSGAMV